MPTRDAGLTTMDAILAAIPSLPLPPTPFLRSPNAFTHSSLYGTKHQTFEELDEEVIKDYERLEFLGDAVLKYLISLALMTRYPGLVPGAATVITAALSRTETFAALSRVLGFPTRLQGALAQIDGLRANDAVCEDVFEAFVGGLHEERGLGVTMAWVNAIFIPLIDVAYAHLKTIHNASLAPTPSTTSYTALMEIWRVHSSRRALRRTDYVVSQSGPSHLPSFECVLTFGEGGEEREVRSGGVNIKAAKQSAARVAVEMLGISH